ncbi:hypothetical protein [Microbacterium azadirachtae]|uniref:hypothetical protein n=1 Tax=Microbacterium azadirachtae TaxID=582680 RepID=UPI000B84476F|nr:hypothetical protein [Microbacterium azadirachtae]
MFTGEFGLALELLRVSMSEQPDGATTALDSLYAAAVELTYVLTDTEVIDTLVTPQRRMDRQIEGLIGLTVGAGHGVRTRLLEATATDIIHTHRRALVDAIFMPVRPAAVFDLARFGKATVEATYRHNAVLLRHIDEVRPRIERRSKWPRGATDGKTVSRRLRPGWAEDVYPVTDVRRDPERDHVGLTRAKVRDVARDQ